MRIEYFEDESFSFLAEQKFHLSLQPHFAEVAQLVEHNLAKVGVAGSSPVFRSRKKIVGSNGGIGRHEGLKIPWPVMAVRVQVPLRVHPTLQSILILTKVLHTTSIFT